MNQVQLTDDEVIEAVRDALDMLPPEFAKELADVAVLVEDRHPTDDLMGILVDAEVDGHHLSEDDVISMITGFVFAGAETTRRQMTAAVQLLAEPPAERHA